MLKDPAFNRRAIYTALHAYFDAASLLKAIAAWDQFCLRGQPSVQRFLAELCQSDALKARRADMLRSILQTLNLPASQLLPNPAPSNLSASAVTGCSPRTDLAFNALIQQLLLRTPPTSHQKLRVKLLTQVRHLPLPEALQLQLQACLVGNGEILITIADSTGLRQAINALYMALCEELGPVEADQLLAQSVAATQLHHPELNQAMNLLL